jgi:hypothetical protein
MWPRCARPPFTMLAARELSSAVELIALLNLWEASGLPEVLVNSEQPSPVALRRRRTAGRSAL